MPKKTSWNKEACELNGSLITTRNISSADHRTQNTAKTRRSRGHRALRSSHRATLLSSTRNWIGKPVELERPPWRSQTASMRVPTWIKGLLVQLGSAIAHAYFRIHVGVCAGLRK